MKRAIPWVLVTVALAALPLATKSPYVIGTMCFIALHGTLAVGMGVLLESAGIFSLAHPTFFGLGAYSGAILAVRNVAAPWLGTLLGSGFVTAVSWLIGAPLLRLKGFYLACATFCLLVIVEISLGQLGSLTGGHEGLVGIPALTIAGFAFEKDVHFYYLTWGFCLGQLWFLSNVMGGRVGRAIRAPRDSEPAARCMGIDIPRYKLQVFMVTAAIASITGSLYCFYLRFTQPGIFGVPLLIELNTMIIIGGGSRIYGPLIGAFVITWLRELIHGYLGSLLPRMTGEVDAIFFGLLIIVILLFAPTGITGWAEGVAARIRRLTGGGSVPAAGAEAP
ncbi:MAG: branched-chain amino acid ABC transporter permease [Deltaproteobacteria bacterium]|nr:branched-chain amino acid ABC transporter permease [Deltaproteobacteria bacterium]